MSQQPPERYRLIDLTALSALCGFNKISEIQRAHRAWVDATLEANTTQRHDRWSESIAVGSERVVEQIKTELGIKARHRHVTEGNEAFSLRESSPP